MLQRIYRGFPAILLLFAGAISLRAAELPKQNDVLRVHEWGTFTALQNERGEALPGINVDDEPVPAFCHQLNRYVLAQTHSATMIYSKGTPQRHPYVTMRLETPVMYFYPPTGAKSPLTLDVSVQFQGGWLTEYYPQAKISTPGLEENTFKFGKLSPETKSSLAWKSVQVGSNTEGPETDDPVWTIPRKVSAAALTVPALGTDKGSRAESEKYLFYRGVGHRPIPLKVKHDEKTGQLTLFSQVSDWLKKDETARIPTLWLLHVRADGTSAYRRVDPVTLLADGTRPIGSLSSHFSESDYTAGRLAQLRDEMQDSLVRDGLFDDEAEAMLGTWQRAYFKTAGLRLFFLVPRGWTDHVLPLTISQTAAVERVMMGRLEIISPEQRTLLSKLAKITLSDPQWLNKVWNSPDRDRFLKGRDLKNIGFTIPDDYQTYLDLGRFRNALVLAEVGVRPTKELSNFISRYDLESFRPEDPGK